MRATVTYETVTPESCEHGDFDDHGWIAPNEYRVRLGKAGRHYGKRVRMAQRGRYDWPRLTDAVRFVLDKARYVQSEADIDPNMGGHGWQVSVTVERSQEDEGCAESVGYGLLVTGLSNGTAERLYRLLVASGCREPYARASSLRRAASLLKEAPDGPHDTMHVAPLADEPACPYGRATCTAERPCSACTDG